MQPGDGMAPGRQLVETRYSNAGRFSTLHHTSWASNWCGLLSIKKRLPALKPSASHRIYSHYDLGCLLCTAVGNAETTTKLGMHCTQ